MTCFKPAADTGGLTRGGVCLPNIEPECPFCDIKLIISTEYGYYKCPDCGGEWWPADEDEDISVLWRDEQAYKRSIAKKGANSSSGKRRNKVVKPLMTERYRLK